MTFFSKGRREFLSRLGIGAGVVAIGYQAAASLRSLVPNVSYDAPTTVKLGQPLDFPDGLKFLPDMRLFVFREGKTFHAISAVCTHLGCTVRAEALLAGRDAGRRRPGVADDAPVPVPVPRLEIRGRRQQRRRARARSRSPGTTCPSPLTTGNSSRISRRKSAMTSG